MKKQIQIALFSVTFALALFGAVVAGAMSPIGETTISSAASTLEPVQASCNSVTVTNVSSQKASRPGRARRLPWIGLSPTMAASRLKVLRCGLKLRDAQAARIIGRLTHRARPVRQA